MNPAAGSIVLLQASVDGQRILSPQTVHLMTSNRTRSNLMRRRAG